MATIKLVMINFVSQVEVFPQALFTVTIIVVNPDVAIVPAAGDCVMIKESKDEQLSFTTIFFVKSGTIAWQLDSAAMFG